MLVQCKIVLGLTYHVNDLLVRTKLVGRSPPPPHDGSRGYAAPRSTFGGLSILHADTPHGSDDSAVVVVPPIVSRVTGEGGGGDDVRRITIAALKFTMASQLKHHNTVTISEPVRVNITMAAAASPVATVVSISSSLGGGTLVTMMLVAVIEGMVATIAMVSVIFPPSSLARSRFLFI